jgi:hypothetical protein
MTARRAVISPYSSNRGQGGITFFSPFEKQKGPGQEYFSYRREKQILRMPGISNLGGNVKGLWLV